MKDDPSALAALAGVEADLLANGWKRMRRAPRADWYEFRFRRTVPAPNAAEAPVARRPRPASRLTAVRSERRDTAHAG